MIVISYFFLDRLNSYWIENVVNTNTKIFWSINWDSWYLICGHIK